VTREEGVELLKAALAAFEARDRDAAVERLTQLERAAAPIGGNWEPAARLAVTLGEVGLALTAARRRLELQPDDPAQQLAYGAILAQCGRIEAAMEAVSGFLPRAVADPQLRYFIGVCAAQLGREPQAERALRAALSLGPFPELAAAAWLNIADLKTFTAGDPDVAAMEQLRARFAAPASNLLYALGKAYDDAGDVATAFARYEAGAGAVRAARPFDAAASSAFVDEVIAGFSTDSLARLPASGLESERPIFVLGLPRSGTTLVEQILASHSAVAGGAELNLFRAATMGLDGYGPRQVAAFAARPGAADGWRRFGETYLHLLDERFGAEGRVVDKTLNHSRFLGLIHHVLPRARFIWLRRDAADTALSCFRSHFAEGLNWSWSFADIGRHFADEGRLYAHWTAQFPEAILTVPYEALVAEPDAWIGRILEHCGLPFEPGVRDFHLTQRAITTTSTRQVREPIYNRAVGGWRRYAEPMRPFFEIYGAPAD
jgi:tetratricopeptide (TPR) repeat protein